MAPIAEAKIDGLGARDAVGQKCSINEDRALRWRRSEPLPGSGELRVARLLEAELGDRAGRLEQMLFAPADQADRGGFVHCGARPLHHRPT